MNNQEEEKVPVATIQDDKTSISMSPDEKPPDVQCEVIKTNLRASTRSST